MTWQQFFDWLASLFNKPAPSPQPTPSNFVTELLKLHNDYRRSKGLHELKLNTKLNNAAQKHSDWMYQNKRLDHYEAGVDPGQRFVKEGYHWSSYGENIASGYPNPNAVFQGWLNSSGHKRNIEKSSFIDVGFGLQGGYWTTDFASPMAFIGLPGGITLEEDGERNPNN